MSGPIRFEIRHGARASAKLLQLEKEIELLRAMVKSIEAEAVKVRQKIAELRKESAA